MQRLRFVARSIFLRSIDYEYWQRCHFLAANDIQCFVDSKPNQPPSKLRLAGKCAEAFARTYKTISYDLARAFVPAKHFASDEKQGLPVA